MDDRAPHSGLIVLMHEWLSRHYIELRKHGFTISVGEQMRVSRLLLELKARDAYPATNTSLGNMLSAVLSSNDEQQRVFAQVFRRQADLLPRAAAAFSDEAAPAEAAAPSPRPSPAPVNPRLARLEAKRFYARATVAFIAAALLLVTLPRFVTVNVHVDSSAPSGSLIPPQPPRGGAGSRRRPRDQPRSHQ